jgi:hypothetical protein
LPANLIVRKLNQPKKEVEKNENSFEKFSLLGRHKQTTKNFQNGQIYLRRDEETKSERARAKERVRENERKGYVCVCVREIR